MRDALNAGTIDDSVAVTIAMTAAGMQHRRLHHDLAVDSRPCSRAAAGA